MTTEWTAPEMAPCPSRAEHIGSLLRPRRLKEAFGAHHAGTLDDVGLAQSRRRLHPRGGCAAGRLRHARSITDGEFRRGSWFLGFVDGVDGLTTAPSAFDFSGEHADLAGALCRNQAGAYARHHDPRVRLRPDLHPRDTQGHHAVAHGDALLARRRARSIAWCLWRSSTPSSTISRRVYRAEIADLAERGCTIRPDGRGADRDDVRSQGPGGDRRRAARTRWRCSTAISRRSTRRSTADPCRRDRRHAHVPRATTRASGWPRAATRRSPSGLFKGAERRRLLPRIRQRAGRRFHAAAARCPTTRRSCSGWSAPRRQRTRERSTT